MQGVRGSVLGFIIWSTVGLLIVGIGIHAFFSRKAVGFWANVNVGKIKEVRKYNRAVGKLFIAYGVVFILLGTPMLRGQNAALIILSMLGVMIETITVMVIYTLKIAGKYKAE